MQKTNRNEIFVNQELKQMICQQNSKVKLFQLSQGIMGMGSDCLAIVSLKTALKGKKFTQIIRKIFLEG